jgi:hypothetical protein
VEATGYRGGEIASGAANRERDRQANDLSQSKLTISMTVPIRDRIAMALACLLVSFAVVALPGCKSNNPNPEQTTESATQKLRRVIASDVAEQGRRA